MSTAEVFIPLSKGQVTVIDFDDFESVRPYSWYAKWCDFRKSFVAARSVHDPEKYAKFKTKNLSNTTVLMHRQIAAKMGFPDVDHANRDTLDNRRKNLRPCSRSQNAANGKLRSHSTTGFKGVSWNTTAKYWAARIGVNNKRIFLGYFETKEEAARAYDKAAIEHFGEFARLNFPDHKKG